jgi:superfamily I DNA/RNA helicase
MAEIRLDEAQEAVLASDARHLVVTAPPGTGKTFLSVRMAGSLVPSLPDGARVLLLTFSNQARTQLEREAARQLSPEIRRHVEVTNYHRLFWTGVLAYRRALGLPSRVDVGSRRRRQQALAKVDPEAVKELQRNEGLIDCLAEYAFPEFRDNRSPDAEVLARLLAAVEDEQRAGRLVFDDLGALFWSLLKRFPAVDTAYRARYPVVIADEHQDASALQDAVVRRLGGVKLVVFADPMQLIHEFRGASRARLDRHLEECDAALTLTTPHRWNDSKPLADWLLAVRRRLEGHAVSCTRPAQLQIETTPATHGFNGMKPKVRSAVSRAFGEGASTVAVLARNNHQVADLRSYLSRQGQYP